MYFIDNGFIQVGVRTKGAELSSLRSLVTNTEYLWQADPQYWGRHSCILFPVIGCTRDDIIIIDDRKYPMRKHGLVRDSEFRLVDRSPYSLTFITEATESSKRYFPYDFALLVKYTISDHRLDIKYTVATTGDERIPFNIGAHPAFNVPLDANYNRADYHLAFSEIEHQDSPIINTDGLIADVTQSVLSQSDKLDIRNDLFDHDALILRDLNSSQVSLIDSTGHKHWTFDFDGFTHLGIWSKNRLSPFVCIEPWYGMADRVDGPQDFRQKPAIQYVGAGEEWSCTHSITLHPG